MDVTRFKQRFRIQTFQLEMSKKLLKITVTKDKITQNTFTKDVKQVRFIYIYRKRDWISTLWGE